MDKPAKDNGGGYAGKDATPTVLRLIGLSAYGTSFESSKPTIQMYMYLLLSIQISSNNIRNFEAGGGNIPCDLFFFKISEYRSQSSLLCLLCKCFSKASFLISAILVSFGQRLQLYRLIVPSFSRKLNIGCRASIFDSQGFVLKMGCRATIFDSQGFLL